MAKQNTDIIPYIMLLCFIIVFPILMTLDWKKILKKIFNRFKNEPPVFKHQYYIGDVVRFGFLPHDILSNKHFEITDINDYFYGDDPIREFTLMDEQRNSFYLHIPITHHPQSISISKKVNRLRLLFKESNYDYQDCNTIDKAMLKQFVYNHPDMRTDLQQLFPPLFQTFNNLKCYDIPEECYQKKTSNPIISFFKSIVEIVIEVFIEDNIEKKPPSPVFLLTTYEDAEHHCAIKIHQYPSNRIETFISHHYPISVIQDL